MKQLFLIATLLGTLTGTAAANRELFDFDWRFAKGDVAGAEELEFGRHIADAQERR